MELNAETLFDYLGKRYEDAFADSPNLCDFVRSAAQKLPKGATVLDVGCGTGRPVAHTLASAGHEVHGIDVSQEMVKIASSQVQGTFQKADMREFNPEIQFDAVFVILSLFQITPGETQSMTYKFAEWVKPGGYVIVGVTPSTSLPANEFTYDSTWECARQMGKPWMDKYTNETFFSEEGWRKLLQSAGLSVESEVCYTFIPNDPDHKSSEVHHLLMAKKVEEQPLLGPYPLPSISTTQAPTPARHHFKDNMVSEDLEALLRGLQDDKTLCLGSIGRVAAGCGKKQNFEVYDGTIDRLPFPSGTFDVVLAPWKLDIVNDLAGALREMGRVLNRGSHARIIIIQAAPDNELVQFLNKTPSLSKVNHQGSILNFATQYLAGEGFGQVSLRRIGGQYVFPEKDVSERCKAAANLLTGGSFCMESQEELISQLELHFLGSEHGIGNQMVMLEAKSFPN
ncbi:hypothetical protein N7447_006011 [Penicillium robsamsonii]|uniref:uncharacterized protein n=1 Tax=Penicillium robsamsonii TaxID=1792511 RepID=UPI002549C0B6|nr:uncharacterized protein N7447_006011 [Penicillium robsamsonii]KAJ5823671.1 hypothetical protein N7447_006011 [Penicillium robsamsonii]